jgi:mono/diheme cytochrome c family protein
MRRAVSKTTQLQDRIEMKAIDQWIVCVAIILTAGFGASSLLSGDTAAAQAQAGPAQKGNAAASQESLIARGQYLVDNVGMCSECHTARDANNNLDNSRYLQGAPTWIMPVHNMTNWAWRAPAIAGLEGFTDAQAETVLEKGVGPNGIAIHPPMHIYHMNHADAQAVVAYLRSLSSNYTQP